MNVLKNGGVGLCRRLALILLVLLAVRAFGVGCTKRSQTPGGSTQAELVSRGRIVYQTNCIACHNPDPHKPGVLGPEVFGASRELIESRVMRAAYPPGYTPKRQTHAMVALPHLQGELDALHAYLDAN